MKLCEDTSKTYSQFKRGSSFEKDFSMIEVVIEQLIGVHSFTFIRFRSILIKREMFLLCYFACYLICYLSISSPGKITNRERDKYHVILRKLTLFQFFTLHTRLIALKSQPIMPFISSRLIHTQGVFHLQEYAQGCYMKKNLA